MVGNKEETEDILQNVFVKVYKNLKSFDETKKFSSWIYRISHNEAVNYLKKRNKKRFISWEDIFLGENSIEAKSDDKSPIENWLTKERKIEVDEAIEKLPKRYKEVLMLRYFSDKSYEEIGKVLGKSVNTVGTLLNRAKKKLLKMKSKYFPVFLIPAWSGLQRRRHSFMSGEIMKPGASLPGT